MKKSMIFIFILSFLLLIPFLSAVTFDLKEERMQGETLITKVSGYFYEPILPEKILLYREHTRIPMLFEVVKIGDDYYLYADFTKRTFGNYSIIVQDTRHISLTETTSEDFGQNFTITKDMASFTVNPGAIVTSKNFLIEARSLTDASLGLEIKVNSGEEPTSEKGFFASLFGGGAKKINETTFTLSPGQTEDIQFLLESFNQGINFVEIKSEDLSYKIPVYVIAQTEEEQDEKTEFRFEPSELNISLDVNKETSRMIYLYNSGKTIIENISVSLSNSLEGLVTLSDYTIERLKNGSSVPIEISVIASDAKKIIDGHVKARINDGTQMLAYSQIHLSFIPGYVMNKTNDKPTSLKTCSEISGMICQANLECSGQQITASDGNCCLGTCTPPVEKKDSGKIVGIIIFVVVIGLLVWFYLKKYKKKTKKEVNLLDIAKEGIGKK